MTTPRPIWTGAVNMGPVSVPVRLYKATSDEGGVAFRLLCPCHNQPIKQLKTCPSSGKPIEGDLKRGIEVGRDTYEEFSEAELNELHVESLHTIALEDFVMPKDVPSELYVREAYYLEPTPVGGKAYLLLREALRRTGAVGLGKIAIRNKERLVTVRANGGPALLLNTLSWPQEIRSDKDLAIPDEPVDPRYTEQAVRLVEAWQADFDPSKFKDTFAGAVKARVADRLAGKPQPVAPVTPVKGANDLFAQLKAAVDASKKHQGATEPRSRKVAGQPGRPKERRRAKASRKGKAA